MLFFLKKSLSFARNLFNKPNKPNVNISFQPISSFNSQNGKGVIYQLPNQSSSLIAKYQVYHEDGQGSFLVYFKNLRNLNKKLETRILKKSKAGQLHEVEALCQQRKLIWPLRFTHRLEVFRYQSRKKIVWLIDIDFHKSHSYGSGTGLKVIKSLLLHLINQDSTNREYCDFLDIMLEQDWCNLIKQISGDKYEHFDDSRINCIVNNSNQTSLTQKNLKKLNEKINFC